MISYKTAQVSDIPELKNLVNSAYRGEGAKVGWTTEADLIDGQRTNEEKLREIIEDPKSSFELVLEDGKIFGCVNIVREKEAIYFGMLTVKPDLQNKGTGKILLNRVEEIARAENFKKVRMTVIHVRDELIAYYERRGYKRTGKSEPFPTDPSNGQPKLKLILEEFEKNLN